MGREKRLQVATRAAVSLAAVALLLACCSMAGAWDAEWHAVSGTLPSGAVPVWQWGDYGAHVSLEDNALHIDAAGGAEFRREPQSIPAETPVTMEARFRILPSVGGSGSFSIDTLGRRFGVILFYDHIVTADRYNQKHFFWGDFTQFHTIRGAYDGADTAYVWLDNQLIFSFTPSYYSGFAGSGGVSFGSGRCDSYWQYVAYSKQFLPVPEPSPLLALVTGLAGLGAVVRRWRRT